MILALLLAFAVGPPTPTQTPTAAPTPVGCDHPARTLIVVAPEIPASLRGHFSGERIVLVTVNIDEHGTVTSEFVSQSSGLLGLDQSALLAGRQTTYTPAFVHCKAVSSSGTFRMDFVDW